MKDEQWIHVFKLEERTTKSTLKQNEWTFFKGLGGDYCFGKNTDSNNRTVKEKQERNKNDISIELS